MMMHPKELTEISSPQAPAKLHKGIRAYVKNYKYCQKDYQYCKIEL